MSWKGKLADVQFDDLFPEIAVFKNGLVRVDKVNMPMRTSDLFVDALNDSATVKYDYDGHPRPLTFDEKHYRPSDEDMGDE